MKKSLFDWFIDIFYFTAGCILCFLVILETVDSFARYLFNRPLPWSVEIVEYSLFIITFFGTAWLLRENKHVNVEVIVERLSPGIRRSLRIIVLTISCISLAFLSYFSFISTVDTYKMGVSVVKMLSIPKFIFLAIMFLGYFMLFLESIREFLQEMLKNRKGE